MLSRIVKWAAAMMAAAAVTTPFSLSYQNLMIGGGKDNLFAASWVGVTNFVDLVIEPGFAWLFWLGIGAAIGAMVTSWIRRLEETSRGAVGRPSFRYIRWEARTIRLAIKLPLVRKLSADFERDLATLDDMLTRLLRMPPLPTSTFVDAGKLEQTGEYLRLVLPKLDPANIDDARAIADWYVDWINQLP